MVSLDFPPTVGGISAHVYELSRALVDAGHQVCVVTRMLPGQTDAFVRRDGLDIYRVRLRWAAPLYGGQINRFIRGQAPGHPGRHHSRARNGAARGLWD